jgi:mono/diheme cytochrome c family protein
MRHEFLRPALLAASLAFAGCSATTASPEASPPAAAADANLIARGEYLVRIGGCNDCHTPGYGEKGGNVPKQQWLVGSPLGFNGPWGTTYAANLRLKLADMDEAAWLKYSGELHTRPIMPDYNVRAMDEGDRRALYRFIRSLGPAGDKAPDYLPPGEQPPPPYMQMVLPPESAQGTAASAPG